MLTLDVPLSREVGEGLPKVREFWWELSLGPYRGMGAEFIRLAPRLLAYAQTKSDAVGEVEWLVSVDSTIARVHQHAAGARRKPSKQDAKRGSRILRTRRSGVAVVR